MLEELRTREDEVFHLKMSRVVYVFRRMETCAEIELMLNLTTLCCVYIYMCVCSVWVYEEANLEMCCVSEPS